MRTPIKKFAEQEQVSLRYLYNEAAAGRLVFTKVGSRTFVDDVDAEEWRALAPKVTGKAGDIAMKVAIQKIEELGKAVSDGYIDRARAAAQLTKVVRKTGLFEQAA
jgi:hypothetical protein